MATATYESALKKLEKIVEELESGDMPLEKSLKKFEEGIALSKFCSKTLDETEARITRLLKDPDGNTVELPFEDDAETGDDKD
jgi:exodeoxyribonuclease VII small subunit